MDKKLVLLFDIKYLERVHLHKDVGKIPVLLHKKYKIIILYNIVHIIVLYQTDY